MRITVDPEFCVGAGQCVIAAATVFDQAEDDGLVVLRRTVPSVTELAAVRDAVERCPSGAIRLDEQ